VKGGGGLGPSGEASKGMFAIFWGAPDIHCLRQFIDWFFKKECDFTPLYPVYDNTRQKFRVLVIFYAHLDYH